MMQKSDLPFGSEFSPSQIDLPKLLELAMTCKSELLSELDFGEYNTNGLAPRAAAFKLIELLDMPFAAARPHWGPTEENDARLIIESEQPIFSRWQVQWKNTEMLTVDAAAIEVGLTYLSKSNVIVMICSGIIEDAVRHYTDTVMRETNLCIVLLDSKDIDAIGADPMHIKQIFRRETLRAKGLRPLDI